MTKTTTVNPFATAEAFADFKTPYELISFHRGGYSPTMSVTEVRKVTAVMKEPLGCSYSEEVWTRSAEADVSTDSHTVILHTMDVATDNLTLARAALKAELRRFNNDERVVEWTLEMVENRWTFLKPGFIRLMWVEDLS